MTLNRQVSLTSARADSFSFRLGGIPVRIDPWLLVGAGALALGPQRGPWSVVGRVLAFVLVVLAHELGHAGVARLFGLPAEVDLSFFRSRLGSTLASLPTARRVAVCVAGPGANLCLATPTLVLLQAHAAEQGVGGILAYFGFVNLGWGVLNLLPLFPFDGGYALAALLDRAIRGQGERTVRWLSIALAISFGGAALASRMFGGALVCALVFAQSAWALSVAREQKNADTMVRLHLQAAYDALERGEVATAKRQCALVLRHAMAPSARRDSLRLLAYAYATSNDWGNLMDMLERGGVAVLPDDELAKYERAASELGRTADAQRIALLRARFA